MKNLLFECTLLIIATAIQCKPEECRQIMEEGKTYDQIDPEREGRNERNRLAENIHSISMWKNRLSEENFEFSPMSSIMKDHKTRKIVRELKTELENENFFNLPACEKSQTVSRTIDLNRNGMEIEKSFSMSSSDRIAANETKIKRQTSIPWGKLTIKSKVVEEVLYGSFTIRVYEDNKNGRRNPEEKKYFFEPMAQLDHLSARAIYNNVTKKNEMRFRIHMWNYEVRKLVHAALSSSPKRSPVNIDLVRVIPVEKAILTSKTLMEDCELHSEWVEYRSSRFLTFRYFCKDMVTCEKLASNMLSNPDQFEMMLRFSVASQRTEKKETNIDIENIKSGRIMNQIIQNAKGDEVLLTADDKNALLEEMVSTVIVNTFSDSEIPSPTTTDQLYKMIETMLAFSKTMIEKADDSKWDSVFWNKNNFRPDKTTNTLNSLMEKVGEKHRTEILKALSKGSTVGGGGGLTIKGLGLSFGAEVALKQASENENIDVDGFLKSASEDSEWNGVKFVPKKMSLSRLNLGKVLNEQTFQSSNIKVSYTQSFLPSNVMIETDGNFQKFDILAQLEEKVLDLTAKVKKFNSNNYPEILKQVADMKTKLQQAVKNVPQLQLKQSGQRYPFHVSRSFKNNYGLVKFDKYSFNEGGPFQVTRNYFLAPVDGVYEFKFTAICDIAKSTFELRHNLRATGSAESWCRDDKSYTTLEAMLKMKKDETALIFMPQYPRDQESRDNLNLVAVLPHRYSHFIGILIKEL